MSCGLSVVVLGQELSTEAPCVGDAKSASAFAGLAWSDIFFGEDGGDDGDVSADGEVLPVEIRALDCEGVNHGEEFLLVGGVIHLRGKELPACEGDRVFARWSLGVSGRVLDGGGLGTVAGEMLGQYGSDGEVGGVSGDIEMASGVGDLEDRGRGDGLLEIFALGGSRKLCGGAEDKDVIKVDDDTDFEEVAEDVVHGRLEGRGGIGESEWHHEELLVPEPRAEGGLVGVLLADTDLVEATVKVDLGKVLGSTETIKELGNPRTSPMGGPTHAMSMLGQCPGDSVHDEEGPALADGGDTEVAGGVEADLRVNRAVLVCEATPFCLEVSALLGAGAGGVGRGLVVGMEESIVVEHAREEVSKGHVGFVGEGGCKVFVAYSFDAGDERKVRNDGVGEVVAEGADVLDEAVRGTGLAEVVELFKVVVNGFLGAGGGSEEVGPLEEGVTWSSGGPAVANFSHPPFGCVAEEAGGGNGESVGKGHVVELKRVLKLG
ncbi:hypothetical protein CBR_g40937 [Chara braunii]|uniref:Uncharacterized protein n=1 Tax=Chara braunii TaxID=69332 RepID=A0A388LUN7_CHABU|nr:hypothetical protein CBR_g40937 [Chara braunii]|eukprot:GBG86036.1 hypothetical protein CBR_g40937 [Chara braunii]